MKKILFMALLLGGIASTNAYAQPAGDPPSMLQQMKEKQKPELVEKVGLSAEQADKVIEINYDVRMQTPRDLKDWNEADRSKKLAELKALREKKLSEVLTPEQVKALNAYYEEKRKNMPQRAGN